MNIKATIIGEHVMTSRVKGRVKIIEDAIDACVTMEPEWTDQDKPTILQIAKFVCDYHAVPVLELKENRSLRYLVSIRKAIAFLTIKVYDPDSLGILKHQLYQKKIRDGIRKQLGGIIGRTEPNVSHLIRGSVNEYLTDKNVKLFYHYLENHLYEEYGTTTK
jgi:hypothetical protein